MMILTLLAAMVAEPELPPCEAGTAIRVTVSDALRDIDALEGQCVQISGWMFQDDIYEDLIDIYRDQAALAKPRTVESRKLHSLFREGGF